MLVDSGQNFLDSKDDLQASSDMSAADHAIGKLLIFQAKRSLPLRVVIMKDSCISRVEPVLGKAAFASMLHQKLVFVSRQSVLYTLNY